MAQTELTHAVVAQADRVLRQLYLPRITSCLAHLSPEQIWWRPNEASNSVGNLVLHLTGNVRQWIISGLGGAPDVRVRDLEFSEHGPLPGRVLVSRLRRTIIEACGMLESLSAKDLARVSHYSEVPCDGFGGSLSRRRTLLPSRGPNHSTDQDADGKRFEVHASCGR